MIVKRTKINTYANFILFLSLSIAVMGAAYFLGVSYMGYGIFSTVPLVIMFVGLGLLGLAFGPLNNYRQKMSVAQKKLNDVQKVLELYNIKYTCKVVITNDLHGNPEIDLSLNFNPY